MIPSWLCDQFCSIEALDGRVTRVVTRRMLVLNNGETHSRLGRRFLWAAELTTDPRLPADKAVFHWERDGRRYRRIARYRPG